VAGLIDDIVGIVGAKGVLTGADVAARPASWLRPEPSRAKAIVRPANTGEVAAVMKLCHAAGQVVIPLGGNTGLVEGATAGEDDILLSLERMSAVESLDETACTLTVEAGVPLHTVQERAAEAELMFPVDFGARGSAQIGGAIATNAGGNAFSSAPRARSASLRAPCCACGPRCAAATPRSSRWTTTQTCPCC
jgi:FAD/FMN-containing dehydrogenase